MADHNKPTITSTYANFVTELDARLDDLAIQLDPAYTTVTNPIVNSCRWVSASNKWQKWNGTSWVDLTSTYSINSATADKLATARTINGVSFDGSANVTVNTNTALTFNNSGSGAASGSTFNGSTATTISYNTIGAQAALGYTPVQQNGGTGQLTTKLYIGWLGSNLGLQVDTTNYGSSWPISITGNAATATTATTATNATNAVPRDTTTGAADIPAGTTAQRPTGTAGKFRYNSTLNQFEGHNGTTWGTVGGGATGGAGNAAFYENDVAITADYTITTNRNAMTAGPITINSGISVTIPSGSVWTIG